jgi:large subunit ribosomal protein L23
MKSVIKKPLITEKNAYKQKSGIYAFECEISSSKDEIKKAVEVLFDVKVVSVKTAICRGHSKQTKSGYGKVPYWKKALVKLKEGAKIALFEGV